MEDEGVDDALVPTLLLAVTLNVYDVVFVRPVMKTYGEVVAVVVVDKFPGEEVIVYEVIGDPPFELGALKYTEATVFPA
jgi:hypothetical protein